MVKKYHCSTPVILLIYHRPDITQKVIDSIRVVQPRKVYVVADGPKNSKDKKLCDRTRELISTIDWPCNIHKIYSRKNLGLRRRVSTGITQVFNKEEQAIIIEDDCQADPTFFRFAEELLNKYKKDERIISIAGFSSQKSTKNTSYVFTKYVESWGWATWKRAWKNYDDDMKGWNEIQETKWLYNYLGSVLLASYWRKVFNWTKELMMDSWAYRWEYSAFRVKGLTAVPSNNLVKNIGFGVGATNTRLAIKIRDVEPVKFPLIHPASVGIDKQREKLVERDLIFNIHTLLMLLKDIFDRLWYWKMPGRS